MIRVVKPASVPLVLRTRGIAETERMQADYDRHRADYRMGHRRFEFDRSLYGDPTVRSALLQAQHGKCAFCESQIAHVMSGDVEHYRPKGGFTRKGRLVLPGYYWLAYDWDNLLLACSSCNQRHKRNLFPLAAGSRRARSHHALLTRERPHFVHPAKEDPAASIGFRDHVAFAVGNSPRGRWTIRGLGLNRPALKGERERHLEILIILRGLALGVPATPERARALDWFRGAVRDDHPYTSMVRAFVTESPELARLLAPVNSVTP